MDVKHCSTIKEYKAVQGQRGPKRGFPTLRCDAPGGGWRCDAATLRRSGGRVALRRCDAATLRRCRWASDAATLLALRRCDAGVTLRRCWRCDAATRERRCDAVGAARRCWRCDAATLRRGSDAATLLALRRFLLQECTRRCVAARHGNPH